LLLARSLEKSRGRGPVPPEHPVGFPGCTIVHALDAIIRDARPGPSVVGWKLDRGERAELLEQFEPVYRNVVADHVTLAAKVAENTPLPGETIAEVVGRIDDGQGVEALVVAIRGTTDRPDGSTYHVTWSLGPGRQARESNDVLADGAWQPLAEPIPLTLSPARWP
jgi:hypothetical protein